MKSLYVLGEPGVGKSTLMRGLTDPLGLGPVETLDPRWPLVKGRRFPGGVELGGPHELFPGTDRLSMGVSPQAVAWVTEGDVPPLVLAEGQRLSGRAFLTALAARTEMTVMYLVASPDTAQERRGARGTDQKASWVAGARTKAHRAAQVAREVGGTVIEVPTDGLPVDLLVGLARDYAGLS